MCVGRVTDRISDTDSSEELSVEKIQCLWEGAPQQYMSNSLLNGKDVWRRDTEGSKRRESQGKDKDALVILVRSFMRFNLRVKQACERARRTVAALYEYGGECFRRGRKVRSRYSIHSGEESEKEVKQVRVITRTQGTLTGLELLPGKRLEKVSEEGGGGDEFESGNKILIFMSVSSKMRLKLKSRKLATIGRELKLCLHAIMQCENRDTICVKI